MRHSGMCAAPPRAPPYEAFLWSLRCNSMKTRSTAFILVWYPLPLALNQSMISASIRSVMFFF